jgi:hypothetical protein
MMFTLKFLLVAVGLVVAGTLVVSLGMNLISAWNAPYVWAAQGTVVEIVAPGPDDAKRIPASGGSAVVEFTGPDGRSQRGSYTLFNSAGPTQFAGKRPGDTVAFSLPVDAAVPNATRVFPWESLSKVCLLLGGTIVLIGGLFRLS